MRYARCLFWNLFNQSVFQFSCCDPLYRQRSYCQSLEFSGNLDKSKFKAWSNTLCSQFPRPQQSPLRMLSLSANFCRRSHRWQGSHSTESLAALLSLAGCGCVAVLGLETLRGGTVWVSTVCVSSLARLANAMSWGRQEIKEICTWLRQEQGHCEIISQLHHNDKMCEGMSNKRGSSWFFPKLFTGSAAKVFVSQLSSNKLITSGRLRQNYP